MNSNRRTFIAIKIKPERKLIDLINNCKEVFEDEGIKWVEQNNLHLTLKFLGETPDLQIEKIKLVLEEFISKSYQFQFKLYGIGYFKFKGKPKVLFAGIDEFEEMKDLVHELEKHLYDLGFEKETRVFKPHLTLGRIKFLKNKKRFFDVIERFKSTEIQMVNVAEVIFYQSLLKPNGPKYIPLKIIQLK